MRIIVQRAANAKCVVDNKTTGSIDKGLMILVGFTEGDNLEKIEYMCKKIVNLRNKVHKYNMFWLKNEK